MRQNCAKKTSFFRQGTPSSSDPNDQDPTRTPGKRKKSTKKTVII